jgi:glycosyltransferase involved in cell wall biosynthesis
MRIGIDARELTGKPTGVGRHLAGLLGAWQANADAARHTFVLFTTEKGTASGKRGRASFSDDAGEKEARPLFSVEVVPGAGGTWWEQTALARAANRAKLDVFFAPGYTAPLGLMMPSVVLVHDLSFASHPEWFRAREGLRRRLLTKWAATRAGLILTVSEAARKEILDIFSLPAHRVRCIYPGISTLVSHEDARTTSDAREPLVLFAGSIFNRRHVPDLIEAFSRVHRNHPDTRMAVVGDNRTYPHQQITSVAAAEGLQDVVSIFDYVPDHALAGLYRRARAFAFLSDYEGFGHPPLEALAAGVPGVLLDTPVAREVCMDAALYVTCRTDAIAGALKSLLFDEAVRARLLSAAPGVLARYSWTNAAQQTLEALEEKRV